MKSHSPPPQTVVFATQQEPPSPYDQLHLAYALGNGYQEIMEACRPFYALSPEPSASSFSLQSLPLRFEDAVAMQQQQRQQAPGDDDTTSTSTSTSTLILREDVRRVVPPRCVSASPEVSSRRLRLQPPQRLPTAPDGLCDLSHNSCLSYFLRFRGKSQMFSERSG